MSGNHYFKLYTGDYLKDTRHLSVTEHGAYLLLLMQQWDTGPIPNDDAIIARILKVRLDVWKKMAPVIRPFFAVTPDGRLAQKRLEAEKTKIEVLRETRAEVGARGGSAKALKDKDARLAIAKRLPEVSHELAMPVIVIEEDTGSLRSPVAVLTASQELPAVTQASSAQILPNATDLLGDEPLSRDKPAPAPRAKGEDRGYRLPKDWKPSQADIEYAQGLNLSPRLTFVDFRDYWLAAAGQNARKTDWSRTWQRWCRQQAARGAKRPAAAQGPREVPKTAGADGWEVEGVVDHCNKLMGVDGDGYWPNGGFSMIIADALNAGADPSKHIYPVMKQAGRKIDTIQSTGWFTFAINGARTGVAAA